MKKLVYLTLVASVIFQAFIGYLLESNREIREIRNNESTYCTVFTIPDNQALSDSDKLFSVLLKTAEETHANLFRTYVRGDNNYLEIVKYILLTNESPYNQTFVLTKGTPLTPEETRSRNSKKFVSTRDTASAEQTGILYGHMYHEDLTIYPFYQVFSELKTAGRYQAELPDGMDKKFFLEILQKNLMKEFQIEIPESDLEGDSLLINIPTMDESIYQIEYGILITMLIAFLLYSLFREHKQIAVLKLYGTSTWKILWILFKNILLVFSGTLVFVALALGFYTKEWPYVWRILKNSVGAYIFTLVVLLGMITVNIHTCQVHQNLNGKSNSNPVFFLNLAVKALSLLLILTVGHGFYIFFKNYQANMTAYQAWEDASSYGIFDAFQAGSIITMDEMNQAEGKIGEYVYPVLNQQGALFIDASDFQPEYLNQQLKQPHYSSVKVNPNYLKKYPLLDTDGKPVNISENETNWILLVPEHYQNQEKELMDYFKSYREGINEIDRDVYNVPANISKGENIKIIWIQDGQNVYSFNSKVSPETAGTLNNVLVEVMTEENSCISDRECVNGNGDSDALKVKLNGTGQETYQAILPVLKKYGVAENLRRLVVLDQYMMEKAVNAKNEMSKAFTVALAMAAILLFTIIQNMVIIFDRDKKDIVVKKLFGWRWYQRFGKYIGISMSISVLAVATYWFYSFVTQNAELMYLIEISLLLLVMEAIVSIITILHTENHRAVDTLKGE
jgi:putative ABC transport system permease protein